MPANGRRDLIRRLKINVPRTDLAANTSGPQSKMSRQDARSCLRGTLHQIQVVMLAVLTNCIIFALLCLTVLCSLHNLDPHVRGQ